MDYGQLPGQRSTHRVLQTEEALAGEGRASCGRGGLCDDRREGHRLSRQRKAGLLLRLESYAARRGRAALGLRRDDRAATDAPPLLGHRRDERAKAASDRRTEMMMR